MLRILVTGGAGFIASNIVDALIELGHEVSILDNLSTGKLEYVNPKAALYQMDISDDAIHSVFAQCRPEIVIHHAAQIDVQTSLNNPLLDAKINIMGTLALLEQCKIHQVRKFIYASSAAVYGAPDYLPVDEAHRLDPISFYGISKHTPEHYIRVYSEICSLDYTIFRYSNVYGIRQDPKGEGGVICIFLDKLLSGLTPTIYGDGEQTRDFIYVKDIVAANVAALTEGSRSLFNISRDEQISVNELLQKMCAILNKSINPTYTSARTGDILHSRLANAQAIKHLKWTPLYSIDQGLAETCAYYQKGLD
ncbi:MAG: UDP-glucose 4-epimerase [Bacilli bacterium]|nr:UDP-glucose 4-epimerase [Bacilli bacterium]